MDLSYREVYTMNREEARRKLVETYMSTGNLSQTARLWGTSRHLVRRYQEEGLAGLKDRSRRPKRTPPEVEERVIAARERTGYGRKRLAWYLCREEMLTLSPNTIRHILRRHGFTTERKPRKRFYPAHWAWEEERPFSLAQVDLKDVLDKGTLGTELWDWLRKMKLLR